MHEQMINEQDSFYTYQYKDHFKILTPLNNFHKDKLRIKNGKKVISNFVYSSEINKDCIKFEKLKKLISSLKLDE
jgi:UDP-N-acetylglucosamine 4,6-dehydratase/5-epimerase